VTQLTFVLWVIPLLVAKFSVSQTKGGNVMLGFLIFNIALLAFIFGLITKRKIISISAILLAICLFAFDPVTAKTIAEVAPKIGGPLLAGKQ